MENKLPLEAVQKAIFAKINGAITLGGAAVAIYDVVPRAGKAKPFIVMGEEFVELDVDKGRDLFKVDIWIYALTDFRGKRDARAIQDQIYALLHREPLDAAEWNVIDVICIKTETTLADDPPTEVMKAEYTLIVEPA